MSQSIFPNINPATTSGNQLATLLNGFKDAVASGFSGVARPPNLQPGGFWVDTTGAPASWVFKIWNGTSDMSVFSLDLATGVASVTKTANQFEISRISADTVGPILKLIKERLLDNGKVLSGDTVGALEIYGAADDNSNPLVARIEFLASDDMTNTASGTYITFSATMDNNTGLSEMMRLIEGRLGVGTQTPTHTIHAKGNGIKSQKESADAVGAVFVSKKSRDAMGQVLLGDGIHRHEFVSTDNASTDLLTGYQQVAATENHTAAAGGVAYNLFTNDIGSIVPTQKFSFDGLFARFFKNIKAPGLYLGHTLNAASAGANQNLAAPATFATSFTGALTSIATLAAPTELAFAGIFLHMNKTGGVLTYKNGASIRTGTGKDLKVRNEATLWLAYDVAAAQWTIVGGTGSGGGSVVITNQVGLVNTNALTIVDEELYQVVTVESAATGAILATAPFGAGPFSDGTVVELIGKDDTKTVTIVKNDAANGCVGDFDEITLGKYQTVKFRFINALGRFILC